MPRADRPALVWAIVLAVVGVVFGKTYVPRLPNHAGYLLVPVDDTIRAPLPERPRRTIFIVVDGLRRDAAESMTITRTLAQHGQCRISDQGGYTVSRPVYAVLSTGLEADRTGVRNNDLTAPIAAESIWQVARASGLSVAGSGHLQWFAQLFPEGFDHFAWAESHDVDIFSVPELADVNLFHPLYVDEAGHRFGGASVEYAAAVRRVDREASALLARLDLERDLVVLTADHGHRDQGGHGGSQPEIRNVLLCFAGPHIARSTERRPFDGRSTAPALALLLGLRFPRHMRAGDDGLDAIWELPRTDGSFSQAYLDDRHRALGSFREANRRAIEGWIGSPGKWTRMYEHEASSRLPRLVLVLLTALTVIAARFTQVRRTNGTRAALQSAAWLTSAPFLLWLAHRVVLGELDYTVINREALFILRGLAAAGFALLAGIALHRATINDIHRLVRDQLFVVVLLVVALTGHVFVYGWPLGFPVPSDAARYFPFYGAIATVGYALSVMTLVQVAARARARSG